MEEQNPLPPVTRWELQETENGPTLFLYDETDTPLTYLVINDEYAGELVTALNESLGVTVTPDEWIYKVPEDKALPPKLHFLSQGTIITTLELTESVAKGLAPKILAVYNPALKNKKTPWWKKHKIKTTLIVTPVILFFGWGILLYFMR